MAVYIKQSPPREGVRGGWEDFNWESLKAQSHADRDYYLGASAKVGICTRGKFEKFDWWTKKKESGELTGEADAELRRVKRFEQQLLEEALGQRPRHLLAGEALHEDEPLNSIAAPEGSAVAAKTLKKLKKEQKRLKKLRKKERKREARRLRMVKRERRSDSRSSRESSPSLSSGTRSGSRGRRHTHTRRRHRHGRSPASISPHRTGISGGSVQFKKHLHQDSTRSCRRSHAREVEKAEGRMEHCEREPRKRWRSHSRERDRQKTTRRSRSLQIERQMVDADHHGSRLGPQSSRRETRYSREGVLDRRRRHSSELGGMSSQRHDIEPEVQKQLRRDNSGALGRRWTSQEHCCLSAEPTKGEAGERRGIKAELLEEEQARKSGRRSPGKTRDARRDSEVLRVKREL